MHVPKVAEGVGFEPTEVLPSPVFKTGAFDRSATLPYQVTLSQRARIIAIDGLLGNVFA